MEKVLKYLDLEKQYYQTPTKLIKSILNNRDIREFFNSQEEINFLDICAGDGAITREVKKHIESGGEHLVNGSYRSSCKNVNINCIEIDPILRDSLKGQGFNVIGEDFEEFKSIPFYDFIFMNPPFSKGDKFLLNAYKLLNGNGRLICILNAETIKNPYTKERKHLKNLIERVGEVEYYENSFKKTKVEVGVIYLKKPIYEDEFDLFGNLKEEIKTDEEKVQDEFKDKLKKNELMTFDKVDNAINIYRNATKQIFKGIDTIANIKTGLSYLDKEAQEFNIDMEKFFEVILNSDQEEAKEKTTKIIRKMIWSYVLKFCDMDKYLFSKHKTDFYNKLDKGSVTLPFTKENILQLFENLFNQRNEYLKKGIQDLFEEITSRHSGNPYSEGWKTNKNWKINKKIIVNWGMIKYESWRDDGSGKFSLDYNSYDSWVNDLDKVVRKISPMECNTIRQALDNAFHCLGDIAKGQTFYNETETGYFKLKFYKKGTLHITFKDDEVLKELNKIGAKLRTDLGYDDWGKTEAQAKAENKEVV